MSFQGDRKLPPPVGALEENPIRASNTDLLCIGFPQKLVVPRVEAFVKSFSQSADRGVEAPEVGDPSRGA